MLILIIFLIFITTACSKAETVQEILQKVEKNNPQLKVIKGKLKVYKFKKTYETSFPDPYFHLSINDIQLFYRPLDRNIEPMQSLSFGLSWKFPFLKKLKAKGDLVDTLFSQTQAEYLLKKQRVLEEALKSLYKIWLYREKLNLIKNFKKISQGIIELSNITYSVGKNSQSDILNSQIYYTFLKKREIKIKRLLEKEKEHLFYLAGEAFEIPYFSLPEEVLDPLKRYIEKIENSPEIKVIDNKIKYQDRKIELSKLSIYPDFTVSGRYFYRKNFNDYISLGISFNLPFLNKRKYLSLVLMEKEVKNTLKKEREDILLSIEKKLRQNYITAEESKETLKILKILIKQTQHAFETVLSEFKVGRKNMVDVLFVLKEILSIKEEFIEEKVRFHTALLKIKSMIGEIK